MSAAAEPEGGGGRAPRRVAALLFLAFLGGYGLLNAGRLRVPDEQEVYFQAESLLERGDLSVPQAVELGVFFGKYGRDGRAWAPYGPGTALFVLPHVALARATVSGLGIGPDRGATYSATALLASFATAGYSALAVALFWLCCLELGAAPRRALLVTLAYGAGTLAVAYATSFFSEGVQTALLLATFLALLRGRPTLAGCALAGAVLCKGPTVLLAPGFAALAYFGRYGERPSWRRLLALAWPVTVAAAIHLGWNTYRFGRPFDFGYDWSETMPPGVAPRGFSGSYWRGLIGLTLSPGKGLLFFAPPVLAGLAGLRELYGRERPAALGIGVMTLISFAFWPNYVFWAGGYCTGPRQLAPLIPFLVLPACFVAWRSRWLLGLTLAGAALQLLCALTPFLQDQSFGPERLPALELAWSAEQALERGELERARQEAAASVKRAQTPPAYRVLARLSERDGRPELAARLRAQADALEPPAYQPYYHLLRDPPPGQPRNRYNLLYCPQVTLLSRLVGVAVDGPLAGPLGDGCENWFAFLRKVRARGLLAGPSFELPLLGALLLALGLGAAGLRAAFRPR